MYSMNQQEHTKNFYVEYTIPVRNLIEFDNVALSAENKKTLVAFIEKYLWNIIVEDESYE